MGCEKILYFLCYVLLQSVARADETNNEERPYEFSFNIVDFQHRYEKKDASGIITGEYGFVTADGVYHETGYATTEDGDFIITKMRNRKITSLKDALDIFKDRPEAAKKLLKAVATACSACKIPVKQEDYLDTSAQTAVTSAPRAKLDPLPKVATSTPGESTRSGKVTSKGELLGGRNKIPEDSKDASNERRGKSLKEEIARNAVDTTRKLSRNEELDDPSLKNRALEKMAKDLFYRFNYTITTHEHQEDGYRSGKKDGSYRAQSENGLDTRVKYLANEFGHQPNVSFVPRTNGTIESHRLKGYSFLWYWS